MFHKPKIPDRTILQKVTTQLPRRGIRPPCNVRVSVHDGTVTLAGQIEFDMQRKAAVHAATSVNGVVRVVDHMTVMRNTIGGWHAMRTPRYVPHPTPPTAESAQDSTAETSGEEAESKPPPKRNIYGR